MRDKSIYVVQCIICGKDIESETKEGICSWCGLTVEMEWPIDLERKDKNVAQSNRKE